MDKSRRRHKKLVLSKEVVRDLTMHTLEDSELGRAAGGDAAARITYAQDICGQLTINECRGFTFGC
ncbi:MAG: hypothetical protein M3279_09750 [Actinomycetota bacterium]|nr:hypothetical protein [Actinomycetota bacterium]